MVRSRIPGADEFEHWIFDEVLPQIRKTGSYSSSNPPQTYSETLRALADAWDREEENKQQLTLQAAVIQEQEVELVDARPKVSYHDLVLRQPNLVTVTLIASDYDMSAQKLNNLLHELKVQFNRKGVWYLYAHHRNKGIAKHETAIAPKRGAVENLKWTYKGRYFIYDLLDKHGIIPLCEQDTD